MPSCPVGGGPILNGKRRRIPYEGQNNLSAPTDDGALPGPVPAGHGAVGQGRLSAVGAAAWLCPILAGGIAVALVALLGRSPDGQGDLGQRIAQRWDRGRDGFWRASFSFGVST